VAAQSTLEQLNDTLSARYLVEREIGEGGMATVYRARDLRHDRVVALKVLRAELSAIIGADRFLSEIKVTANLQHPNILPLFDSGVVNGVAFYAMPFVEGESLADRLSRDKQLPVGEAVRIATEVASALDYAHRHGVIHRDVKPANVGCGLRHCARRGIGGRPHDRDGNVAGYAALHGTRAGNG
jgi:serine/threonine-protein kinase